jgi:hypothetical protein
MSFGTGAGKGSLPRKVNLDTYSENYERIFGKAKADPVVATDSDDDFDEPLDLNKACSLVDDECESCQ